mgnify:CR=1 FL=1
MYIEDEYLMLSGIQHYYFCRRQWALIHIEQQWAENQSTMEGNYLHEKADMPFLKEKRKDFFISRSIPISSAVLGLNGVTDVVEFRKSDKGVRIKGKPGVWHPEVIEYKRGKEKTDDRDIVQLCAQVMCLEETWETKISKSSLYYFGTNKRIEVHITDNLRQKVQDVSNAMHDLYRLRITPSAEIFKNCSLCSLYDICMPRITKKKASVCNYLYGEPR